MNANFENASQGLNSKMAGEKETGLEISHGKPYVYVLVREDLSYEQKLVQASHAALEAGFRFPMPRDAVASVIILSVPNLASLTRASERLKSHGIDHHLFFEPDFDMGHSALATRPLRHRDERFLMRKYPLFKMRGAA